MVTHNKARHNFLDYKICYSDPYMGRQVDINIDEVNIDIDEVDVME